MLVPSIGRAKFQIPQKCKCPLQSPALWSFQPQNHPLDSTKTLFFLRVGGDAMRNLIGWCPETRQPTDLQLHVDDATLSRVWSNLVRFQCPHCGVKHET